jgi:carbamoyl-phosphate synthase small subunit
MGAFLITPRDSGRLVLADGATFEGYIFGHKGAAHGEVVFNTGMVGYPESLTDPSYKGQILVLTYPLIGNYGVPEDKGHDVFHSIFESSAIQVRALVVSDYSLDYSHWEASKSLDAWLAEHRVPGLYGIDTRQLTKHLREAGSMLGKIEMTNSQTSLVHPNVENLVSQVSVREPVLFPGKGPLIVLIDCGSKNRIIRNLMVRGVTVLRVPWDYDFLHAAFDAVVVSNGPGDPKVCGVTVAHLKEVMKTERPILGICLGNQLLALAAGADTYKLKFGHRGHNQPCIELTTGRCFMTSQNHSYAVMSETLPTGWEPWFVNANDGTNEGIRHRSRPFMSVQFHPEAAPGPDDTGHLFDDFLRLV